MSTWRRAAGAAEKVAERITAWSFSRFRDWAPQYGGCPRKARFKHIEKMKEPEGPALSRGGRIHKLGEAYLLGKLRDVPDEYKLFAKEMKELRRLKAKPEAELTFDAAWALIADSPGNQAWFSKLAWLRVKIDARALLREKILRIVDYKTGKGPDQQTRLQQDLNELQLKLYGVSGLLEFPVAVRSIHAELWHLDTGDIVEDDYPRSKLEELRGEWSGLIAPMLADETFDPNPGPWCRYCHFRKSNGGPCTEG